jgi:hypothetical protein
MGFGKIFGFFPNHATSDADLTNLAILYMEISASGPTGAAIRCYCCCDIISTIGRKCVYNSYSLRSIISVAVLVLEGVYHTLCFFFSGIVSPINQNSTAPQNIFPF